MVEKEAVFRFKLQRVLDLRRQVRERIESELVSLQERRLEAQELLEALIRERRTEAEQFLRRETFTIAELQLLQYYLDGLADRIEKQRELLADIERQVQEKLSELFEARKREKIMHRLYEKEWTRYLKELARKETKALDEIAVRRYVDEHAAE